MSSVAIINSWCTGANGLSVGSLGLSVGSVMLRVQYGDVVKVYQFELTYPCV